MPSRFCIASRIGTFEYTFRNDTERHGIDTRALYRAHADVDRTEQSLTNVPDLFIQLFVDSILDITG